MHRRPHPPVWTGWWGGWTAASTDAASESRRVAPAAPLRGSDLVDAAHAAGLAVYTWTLRPENRFLIGQFRGRGGPAAFGDWESEWDIIRQAGVDGVFVDHPDLGVGFLRR